MSALIESTSAGLYCATGGFYIDPPKGTRRAIITHAHSDHARGGSENYLCSAPSRALLQMRLGGAAHIESIPYGETRRIGGARVSLHPAGHILGSAQVRVEAGGEVWVVSGDYNVGSAGGTCAAFEPVSCDVFITESTFALPIYRWPDPAAVFADIHRWWVANQAAGVTSVLSAYPLGKSQRLLAGLDAATGPIAVEGNAARFAGLYREAGVRLAPFKMLEECDPGEIKGRGLVLTSSAAGESEFVRRLEPISCAFASGWMMTRAARRSRSFDRGFVLSDHADWEGLVGAVRATGAGRILVTHGETQVFARWLKESGWDAAPVEAG